MRVLIIGSIVALIAACGSGELSTNSDPGNNGNNGNNANSSNNSNNQNNVENNVNNVNNVGQDAGSDDSGSADAGSDDGVSADTSVDSGPEYHPMFIAVADFFILKCVNCHAVGENGNFAMPQGANPTYEEVRLALDGTVATTNRLIIEPGDPAESQAFIMMTNAAGEQFEEPTIAVVRDWINAGAPYFVE